MKRARLQSKAKNEMDDQSGLGFRLWTATFVTVGIYIYCTTK
jgi:hypothetical protein